MDDLTPLLNWKLLRGSHEFPGPDGGTCVNEAAMVASGFAYRAVGHARELPSCFCPLVGTFSIWLNDSIHDPETRMRLLSPFVTRLAGTRGGPEHEGARLEALRACVRARLAAKDLKRRFTHRHVDHLLLGPWLGGLFERKFTVESARDIRELIRICEFLAAGRPAAEINLFFAGMAEGLEAMLAIGPRPTPPEAALLAERIEAAKTRTPALRAGQARGPAAIAIEAQPASAA